MNTLAALPMYALPELRTALSEWWRILAHEMTKAGIRNVPDSLRFDLAAEDLWGRKDILLIQTCGYPLIKNLVGQVSLLGTPCYQARGCEWNNYSSLIIVRESSGLGSISELEGTRCVFNQVYSHSGYNAFRSTLAPIACESQPFFRSVSQSGAHPESIKQVRLGKADVCAVDCVTYALLEKYRPESVTGLEVLAETVKVPGLPYVTGPDQSKSDETGKLTESLARAFSNNEYAETRSQLLLKGFTRTTLSDYQIINDMENDALSLGYASLN